MEKINVTTSEQCERTQTEQSEDASFGSPAMLQETVQDADYRLGVRTMLAITALALGNCCAAFTNSSNTSIRFQVESVGGANLASWIGNASFLLTLTFGPIFVSNISVFPKHDF